MKLKFLFYLLMIVLIMPMSFIACSDKDDDKEIPNPPRDGDDEENEKNKYVNNWIYDNLADLYLWNDKMPEKDGLDLNLDPYVFFFLDDGVLYRYGQKTGDRFSRIEGTHASIPKSVANLEEAAVGMSDIGFEYINIQFINENKIPTGKYAYLVLYVKKNTNAEKQGLKRGHLILEVDGTEITTSNRHNLLYQNKGSYTLSVNDYELKKRVSLKISTTSGYEENPIFLDSIYTIGGRKIGYVVYNSFEAGGEAALPYDVELSKIFTKFRDGGVSDLVLDLRYNGGGLVRSAQFIASALVPDRNADNIFEIKTYNPSIQAELDKLPDNNATKKSWMYDYFVDNVKNSKGQILSEIPRLGDQLNNLYVIGTRFTASASEMVVNTLRPYMQEKQKNVILIGENTVGKNVGSWAIYENDNSDNTYVMWPIIFKSHNKLYFTEPAESSRYAQGFTPDIEGIDFDLFDRGEGLKKLGDIEESLLSAALAEIAGTKTRSASYSKTGQKKFISKESSLENKRNANQLTIEKHKSSLLKEQLKSLGVEQ